MTPPRRQPPDSEAGCALCERDHPLTYHHLIPRTLHRKRWAKVRFSADALQAGIWVCRDCHDAIHRFISHRELAESHRSVEALLGHEQVGRFVRWVRTQGGRRRTARHSRR